MTKLRSRKQLQLLYIVCMTILTAKNRTREANRRCGMKSLMMRKVRVFSEWKRTDNVEKNDLNFILIKVITES